MRFRAARKSGPMAALPLLILSPAYVMHHGSTDSADSLNKVGDRRNIAFHVAIDCARLVVGNLQLCSFDYSWLWAYVVFAIERQYTFKTTGSFSHHEGSLRVSFAVA